jgi:16S rRNA (guanine966-N2)-methyltransferase
MTRIIAGTARGRRLRTPSGDVTRPTTDRVREALFSALDARLGSLAGLRFLDMYAGSGAVGLEARSRGAASVTLVESNRSVAAVIRANVQALGLDAITVIAAKAERMSAEAPPDGSFDVAFFDPPYSVATTRVTSLLADLLGAGWFTSDGWLVVERDSRGADLAWPDGMEAVQSRRYGETLLWYGRVGSNALS